MITPFSSDNGILRTVPGEFVAQGHHQLPDPAQAPDHDYRVLVDAGHAGIVTLTYRRQQNPRFRTWFWSCTRADAGNLTASASPDERAACARSERLDAPP